MPDFDNPAVAIHVVTGGYLVCVAAPTEEDATVTHKYLCLNLKEALLKTADALIALDQMEVDEKAKDNKL